MPQPAAQDLPFEFTGGRLCLDFANTMDERPGDHPRERLERFADLAAWSRAAGVLTADEAERLTEKAERRPVDAAAVLARSIALREAIYHIFSATAAGRAPDHADLDTLHAELSLAIARSRIVPAHTGFAWQWAGEEDALDRMLWPVARSAVELLTSNDLPIVRECGGRDCSWLFVDTTKNHSRQWCDMRTCGNREKVRRHYERKKSAAS